jgi:hypothetical protein
MGCYVGDVMNGARIKPTLRKRAALGPERGHEVIQLLARGVERRGDDVSNAPHPVAAQRLEVLLLAAAANAVMESDG